MSYKVASAFFIALVLWASAFVGIRAGLQHFSPEGLALLRYLIASSCMTLIFYCTPASKISWGDRLNLMALGIIGIGLYNIMLNKGEVVVASGVASFIVSQSPLLTTLFALIILGERLTWFNTVGLLLSVLGIVLIYAGERTGSVKWDTGMFYVLIATLISGIYSVWQKSLLKRCNAVHATAYIIWGGTLFLLFYAPKLQHDLAHTVTWQSIGTVVYLGIFPGAMGYVAWNYGLTYVPVMRAASLLYSMPFIATLLGWLCLGEIPALLSMLGGIIAIAGVWLINQSYRLKLKTKAPLPEKEAVLE